MRKEDLVTLCNYIAESSHLPLGYLWDGEKLTEKGALLVTFSLIALVQGFFNKFFGKEKSNETQENG